MPGDRRASIIRDDPKPRGLKHHPLLVCSFGLKSLVPCFVKIHPKGRFTESL